MTETTTYNVHVIREFDAPIERLWEAWTEPADLRAWWGPAGFECTWATADVRPGGRIFVTMRAPAEYGGFEQHSVWNITDVQAPERLGYLFTFTDADGNRITPEEAGVPEGIPDGVEQEVMLADIGDGRTRLEMTEYGYTSAESRDLSREGLEQCLDKMAALVEDTG
ncbi:SRPBCC domain-containing protein [Glaciihabitans sp. dw_435]|uniref:SRPBCC family protein n=1 Tax=Glaciihabitans sp. dw_435 TaxID=2720081 RepID=UPI001BD5E864|nr:SRPBCC domain-containing protein [Glaciihabitans sp. dw_435]